MHNSVFERSDREGRLHFTAMEQGGPRLQGNKRKSPDSEGAKIYLYTISPSTVCKMNFCGLNKS